jgi:hypothetical protein
MQTQKICQKLSALTDSTTDLQDYKSVILQKIIHRIKIWLTRVWDYNANRKIEKKSLAPTSATTATQLNCQVEKSRDISPLWCSGMQTILARLNWLDWIYEWTEWMIELNELIWLNWTSRPICTTRIAETTCRKLAETNCRNELPKWPKLHDQISITFYITMQFYLSVYLPATEEKHQNTQKYNFSTHNKNKYLTYKSFADNTANSPRWQKKTDSIPKQQPPRDWTPSRKSELRLTCRPSLPGVILIGSNCEIWL